MVDRVIDAVTQHNVIPVYDFRCYDTRYRKFSIEDDLIEELFQELHICLLNRSQMR